MGRVLRKPALVWMTAAGRFGREVVVTGARPAVALAEARGAGLARGRGLAIALCLLASCAISLYAAAPAGAYVYWGYGEAGSTYIGRSDTDGAAGDPTWLKVPLAADGTAGACQMTATSSFLYWGNCNGGTATTIGSASIGGSGANNNFITGASNPCGVAVRGSYIYWVGDDGNSIGRANINGSAVNQDFITTGAGVCGLAASGSYIYWGNYRTETIGRANIDGSAVDQSFITGAGSGGTLAVNSSYIYFSDTTGIGRAKLNGSQIDASFIRLSNVSGITAIALDRRYIYWANSLGGQQTTPGKIGRARLNGAGIQPRFITTPPGLYGIAVDARGPRSDKPTHRRR